MIKTLSTYIKRFLSISLLFLFAIMLVSGCGSRIANETMSVDSDVNSVIFRQYSECEIKEKVYQYVDWSSIVKETDDIGRATRAEVTIIVDNEERVLHLEKKFVSWTIKSDYPKLTSNLLDEEYFKEVEFHNVGKRVDIEAYCNREWVLPLDNGDMYKKVYSSDDDWYYSLLICKAIYKVNKDGIFEMNKNSSDWESSADVLYSDLNYYSNYEQISEEEAKSIIELLPSSD